MAEYGIVSQRRQRALLHYYGGDDLEDLLDTLDNTGSRDEIKPALDALSLHFAPVECSEEASKLTTTHQLHEMCSREMTEKMINDESCDENSHEVESIVENNAY